MENQMEELIDCTLTPLGYCVNIYLFDFDKPSDLYQPLFDKLSSVSAEMLKIILHINSSGGDVSVVIQIIEHLKRLKEQGAHIHIFVEGYCHSAATFFLHLADSIEIAPTSSFLFHDISTGVQGKVHNDIIDFSSYLKKWVLILSEEYYTGILTEDEIKQIIFGKELWFTSVEIQDRLNNYIKSIEEEKKKIEDMLEQKLKNFNLSFEKELGKEEKRKRRKKNDKN